MRIQLNHRIGETCINPITYKDDFTVIDVNGIHEVAIDYCGCQMVETRPAQLLRFRLYPATVIDPKTAATFQVLESFHLTTLISKISTFDFYTTLSRRTDNTGTLKTPVRCISTLLDCYRHLSNVVSLSSVSINGSSVAALEITEADGPRRSTSRKRCQGSWRLCCSLPRLSASGKESSS
jgi:hypothetical protein